MTNPNSRSIRREIEVTLQLHEIIEAAELVDQLYAKLPQGGEEAERRIVLMMSTLGALAAKYGFNLTADPANIALLPVLQANAQLLSGLEKWMATKQ